MYIKMPRKSAKMTKFCHKICQSHSPRNKSGYDCQLANPRAYLLSNDARLTSVCLTEVARTMMRFLEPKERGRRGWWACRGERVSESSIAWVVSSQMMECNQRLVRCSKMLLGVLKLQSCVPCYTKIYEHHSGASQRSVDGSETSVP